MKRALYLLTAAAMVGTGFALYREYKTHRFAEAHVTVPIAVGMVSTMAIGAIALRRV